MCVRAVALSCAASDAWYHSEATLPPGNLAFAYLLGLLALIKCSICSYTADTVYATHVVALQVNQFLLGPGVW